MKKHIASLAAAVVAICSASAGIAAPQYTWAQSYGTDSYSIDGKFSDDPFYGSGTDVPQAMAKMPDGGYVVAGQIDLPELYRTHGGHTSALAMASLVRYAVDGTILWQTVLRQTNDATQPGFNLFYPGVSHVSQVATDAQGNIFVCGYKGGNGYNDNSFHAFVAKFSPAGGLIWQNGIGAGSAVVGTPPQTVPIGAGVTNYMSLTNDGGVVITVAQSRPLQAYTIPALVKFNADGSFAFSKAYENSIQYLGTTPVCQSKDGLRYVMAFPFYTDGSALGSRYALVLLVTDASGNIIGQRGYNHSDNPGEQPVAIIATADGGFATLSGPYSDGNFGILRKFNADLSAELFEKRIAITPGQARGALLPNSLVETADGGFLLGGVTQNQDGTGVYDVMLMKLNSGGALQFVSLLGGPKNDGGPSSTGPSSAFAIEMADGGYGLAATSGSYHVGGSLSGGFYDKPDWWMAKTDANRKVRGFSGTMVDQLLGTYQLTGSPETGAIVTTFTAPGYPYSLSSTNQPQFIFEDLGGKSPPNQPTVIFQASGPRIGSGRRVEAVVGQHFSYQILGVFFDAGKTLTYSASGLPSNFVIDSTTGIISGVAQPGTETTTPIAIALQVTDGTNTATATLKLTIGDGVPMLTVNGSNQASPNLSDKPLAFAATYPGSVAGRFVSVQSSSDPSNPASWVNLPTGTAGYMTLDIFGGHYVLNTTNYPQQNGLSFRVRVTAPSKADVFSDPVGPFDLASGKARAGQTLFRVLRNQLRADLDFRATQVSPAAGVALRVQSSTSPGDEGSWTDLVTGSAMQAIDSTHFAVATNNSPKGDGIYFRAVAAASGFVDSLSNVIGPFTLAAVNPAKVSITSPTGAASNPAVVIQGADGSYQYQVNVTPTEGDRPIATLRIAFDGEIVSTFSNVTSGQVYTATRNTTVLGDHVVEAIAIDDLGVVGRAGTGPQYLRILPPTNAAALKAEKAGSATSSAATIRRNVFSVANSGGGWDDPSTWKDLGGNPGIPGQNDFVIIGSAQVVLNPSRITHVFALSINGGTLKGPGSLTIGNMLTVSGGTFAPTVFLNIAEGALCEALNAQDFMLEGTLQNLGTINVHGARGFVGISDLQNQGTINFQLPLLPSEQVALGLPLDPRALTAGNFDLKGKVGQSFIGPNGTPLISPNGAALIAPNGAAVVGNSGGTLITNDGGSLITNDGGSLITNDGGSLITNDGGSLISNDGGSIISNDGASLLSENGLGFKGSAAAALIVRNGSSNSIAPNQHALTAPGGIAINGGEVDLTGISLSGAVTLNSGVLSGSGIIYGSLTNSGGFISPGHSAGQITVTGNFEQTAKGTLVMEAAGGAAGQFDRLQIGGTASLGGRLELRLTNGFVPLTGDQFNPVGYNSTSGSFASVSSNALISVNANGVSAAIDPAKPNPRAGQPLNIATRLQILGGDNLLIGGFIISGPAGSTKKVLIRGLGPTLSKFGVPGAMADPLLELHDEAGGLITSNDNWQSNDINQIPADYRTNIDPLDSIVVATLTVGSNGLANYTAILKGAHDETGVGLAEVYDLEPDSAAQLANIATRGFVQTGDNVMIGGFIIGGTEPAKVLVRVTGPTLTKFGITAALTDPTLELHDSNGAVISNDDWRATQESEINATALQPADPREPAIFATLAPGSYTAVVRGKSNTTGIAVVEAYTVK